MGVRVDYLLNGPGALYFLRCVIFMENLLNKSVFSSLDSSASFNKTVYLWHECYLKIKYIALLNCLLLFVDPIARPRDTDWKEVGDFFI